MKKVVIRKLALSALSLSILGLSAYAQEDFGIRAIDDTSGTVFFKDNYYEGGFAYICLNGCYAATLVEGYWQRDFDNLSLGSQYSISAQIQDNETGQFITTEQVTFEKGGSDTGTQPGGSTGSGSTNPPDPGTNPTDPGTTDPSDPGTTPPAGSGTNTTQTKVFEAEQGIALGSARQYNDGAASGGAGVAYLNAIEAGVEFRNVPKSDKVSMSFASQMSGTLSLVVNGADSGVNLQFNSNGTWVGQYVSAEADISIPENATVQIKNLAGDSAANIDSVTFFASGSDGSNTGGSDGSGGSNTGDPSDPSDPTDIATGNGNGDIGDTGKVALTKGTFVWDTYGYDMRPDFSLASYDHNPSSITSTSYETWVIENDYLKVTVLPSFGGRILSIFNKATGREELYQNPVGTPYLVNSNIFYYNWLMIMGGIFPTFPEPEHGKSWNREWDLEVVTNTDDEVTLAMSYTDKDSFAGAPSNYVTGTTNITATYNVTLKANRSAVDAEIVLDNPENRSPQFEYWTDTTLSPGSDPKDPRATAGLEMIAPIDRVDHIYGIGPTHWDGIKWYKNHTGEGIAYASPNMQGKNFWGVINHDNEEGIFRIADNTKTPGLKIWTFGFPDSTTLDPYADGTQWHRPAIELWAGFTNQFFHKMNFPANSTISVKETYSPSVAMENVTHANERVLLNLSDNGLEYYFMDYDTFYNVVILKNGQEVHNSVIEPEALGGKISGNYASGTTVNIYENGVSVFSASN